MADTITFTQLGLTGTGIVNQSGASAFTKVGQMIAEVTTSRTLATSDAWNIIGCINPVSTTTIIVPTNASVPIPTGSSFTIINLTGTQVVTLSTASITFLPNILNLSIGQGGRINLTKLTASNVWTVDVYEEAMLSLTLDGAIPSTAFTGQLTRRNNGVRLNIPAIDNTSNSATTLNISSIPARFQSSVTSNCTVSAQVSTAVFSCVCSAQLMSDTINIFSNSAYTGNFPTSNTIGTAQSTFIYELV